MQGYDTSDVVSSKIMDILCPNRPDAINKISNIVHRHSNAKKIGPDEVNRDNNTVLKGHIILSNLPDNGLANSITSNLPDIIPLIIESLLT